MSVETGGDGGAGESTGSDFFQQYQREMGETRQTASEAASKSSRNEQILSKLQAVFTGEDGEPAQDEWFDQIMNAAFEAEKNGQPMPITVQVATQLMDTQKQLAKATQIIQQLQARQERLDDPSTTDENMAYSDIDKTIRAQLNQVYGGQESPHIRTAIEGSIVQELKYLREKEPAIFQKVINDDAARKKMVKHFVMAAVPPKARQIVEEVREATAPITQEDFSQAWQEAQMIEDSQLRSEVQATLRQEFLAQRNKNALRRR